MHDVMTPLTVLQGHLSSMQQRTGRGESAEAAVLASAMGEAHYIASLVHNLAAAARLEAGAPQVQRAPVDLNAVIARVIGRHQPIARQRRISLESGVPEAPVWVSGDVTLIEQAVSNVVFNGIHWSAASGAMPRGRGDSKGRGRGCTSPTMSRRSMGGRCHCCHRSTAGWRWGWRAR
jgi:signal transduction histidine kinase